MLGIHIEWHSAWRLSEDYLTQLRNSHGRFFRPNFGVVNFGFGTVADRIHPSPTAWLRFWSKPICVPPVAPAQGLGEAQRRLDGECRFHLVLIVLLQDRHYFTGELPGLLRSKRLHQEPACTRGIDGLLQALHDLLGRAHH